MDRLSRPRTRSRPHPFGRALMHVLVLLGVMGLVLTGNFPVVRGAPASMLGGRGGPGADPEPPAPDWMTFVPVTDGTSSGPTLAQANPAPTALARPTPDLSVRQKPMLPTWLRTTHETPLWSGPDAQAVAFTSLPEDSFLRPLGPYLSGRLSVYYPGDGGTRAAGQAWVDAQNVNPSGPPPWVPVDGNGAPLQARPSGPQHVGSDRPPTVTARNVAILDEDSGQLLYGDRPAQRIYPASTTKILTTALAIENTPDLKRPIDVTVSASEMVNRDGSSTMGLEPGLRVSMETLLYGMMLPSGNDAAEQVALAVGGTREHFVELMNQKIAWLGLKETHFTNPSGMDDPNHYSSAYDMAMLARYAMRNDTFRRLAAAPYYVGDDRFSMKNLNRLLGVFPGADGVKIGYTDIARKTFIASATHDGHRVYVSLMRSEDIVGDSEALFEWVWGNFTW